MVSALEAEGVEDRMEEDVPWSRIRNVFSVHEPEGMCHAEHLARFDNGVPNFATAQEAEQYIRDFGGVPSHPKDPSLTHGMTLFTSMDELQEFVFPKIYQLLESRTRPGGDDPQTSMLTTATGSFVQGQNQNQNQDQDQDQDQGWGNTRVSLGADVQGSSVLEDRFQTGMWDAVEARLSWGIHAEIPVFEAVRNTFDYLYHHMKFGIFVMIQDSEIKIFAPFVNHREYKNTWWPWCDLRSESDVHRYYQQKAHYLGMPLSKMGQYNANTSEWWVNGNILCNWTNEDIWGDHFLFALKHMLAETCRRHPVPDCAFFVNKRDYPQLKFNRDRGVLVEPYGFMWDRNDKKPEADVDLPAGRQYEHLLPVLSFYTSNRFADLGMPCTEDWEAATGRVFPCTMLRSRIARQDIRCRDLFALGRTHAATGIAWHHKRHTAFFRGTATGSGVSADTNPRIRLAQLDYEWNHPARSGGGGGGRGGVSLAGYLDAKLTGWNLRDKKRPGHRLSFVKKHQYLFRVNGVQNFVPLAAQAQYKYLIYVDGHCAACRFGYMMSLGSVILRVESDCVADEMWYFHLLEPYRHFVPVKADLSDLRQKIEWCRKHDAHCRAIAENARIFHRQYLSKEGMMKYLYGLFSRIHERLVLPVMPPCPADSAVAAAVPVSSDPVSASSTLPFHVPVTPSATSEILEDDGVVQGMGGGGGEELDRERDKDGEKEDVVGDDGGGCALTITVTAPLSTEVEGLDTESRGSYALFSPLTTTESAASGFWMDSGNSGLGAADVGLSTSSENAGSGVIGSSAVVLEYTGGSVKRKVKVGADKLHRANKKKSGVPCIDPFPSCVHDTVASSVAMLEKAEKAMQEVPFLSFLESEEPTPFLSEPPSDLGRKKIVVRVTSTWRRSQQSEL